MILLSNNKLTELEAEYKSLLKSLRSDDLEFSKQGGPMDSFKEAAAIAVARGAKNQRVEELKRIIWEAKTLPDYVEGERVILGKWVSIIKDGQKLRYRLVDEFEAQPAKNLISQESPLGKVLMNKNKGDFFLFGKIKILILDVE